MTTNDMEQVMTVNRRFSSKVSSSRCQFVEPYLKAVYRVAKKILGNRASWWYDEYGELCYHWGEVRGAEKLPTQDRDLFLLSPEKPTYLKFEDVCEKVLAAFSKVHVGMDGLQYDSASFPPHQNYSVTNRSVGMHSVDTINDWANSEDAENEVTRQAYWATRCNNNCQALNRTLLLEIQHSRKDVVLITKEFEKKLEAIETSSLELKIIGLTPKLQGRIVEPPMISNVPPSPDGETYHLFISGFTKSKQKVYGMDCSCAQFGVFSYDAKKPFLASELRFFLQRLGKHRVLKPEEQSVDEMDLFVQHKIDGCLNVMRILDET